MSCGGEIIDNYGFVRSFPAASMLTGLLANALGWRRIEAKRHQDLQDQMIFAIRIDREPAGNVRLRDYQTAQLTSAKHWTTRGEPEGRAGGGGAFFTHLRYRDYFADMRFTVAIRLEPADAEPTLDDLADALDQPARPLFIGRKPCLPSAPMFDCFSDGDTALASLLSVPLDHREGPDTIRLLWPENDTPVAMSELRINQAYMLTDQRNWTSSGLHGGGRMVCEGTIEKNLLPGKKAEASQIVKDEEL